jgi:hypothetical protein
MSVLFLSIGSICTNGLPVVTESPRSSTFLCYLCSAATASSVVWFKDRFHNSGLLTKHSAC